MVPFHKVADLYVPEAPYETMIMKGLKKGTDPKYHLSMFCIDAARPAVIPALFFNEKMIPIHCHH